MFACMRAGGVGCMGAPDSRRMQEAALAGDAGRLGARSHVQFRQDVVDVVFDRADADAGERGNQGDDAQDAAPCRSAWGDQAADQERKAEHRERDALEDAQRARVEVPVRLREQCESDQRRACDEPEQEPETEGGGGFVFPAPKRG